MPATDTPTVTPLTTLKEEENLFRAAVRDFAEETIGPFVASMDENGRLEPTLLPKLFDLGLMGIEIPEAYGGPGGSFFMSCLAIEELSRVDAAVAVVVDVHNTWSPTPSCAGAAPSNTPPSCPGWRSTPSRPTRCPKPTPAATPSPCRPAPRARAINTC